METIMVVDDEPGEVNLFRMYFEEKGYNVICCVSGEECLEKLVSKDKPKYIIMDVLLPGKRGCEICKTIKSKVQFKHTKIVLISTLSEQSLKDSLEKSKADYFIEKGGSFTTTINRIEKTICM